MEMMCSGNGRENLPPGCVEPDEEEYYFDPDEAIEEMHNELKHPKYCHDCEWFNELAEGLMDDNGDMEMDQWEFLQLQCAGCHGKTDGKRTDHDEEHLLKHWCDFTDWVDSLGLKYGCRFCKVVYRIYGKYKDPDDEWNAIDSRNGCMNCKRFGED